jgi:hypothetical protein
VPTSQELAPFDTSRALRACPYGRTSSDAAQPSCQGASRSCVKRRQADPTGVRRPSHLRAYAPRNFFPTLNGCKFGILPQRPGALNSRRDPVL